MNHFLIKKETKEFSLFFFGKKSDTFQNVFFYLMDPEERKKFLRALLVFIAIFFLFIVPQIFPLLIFFAILFFSLSNSGKKFFQNFTDTKEKKSEKKQENDPLEAFRNHSSRRSAQEKNNESKILASFEKFFSSPPDSKNPLSSFPLPPMNKFSFSALFIGLGIVIFTLLIVDGFVSVPPGHVAVIYDRGRGVLEESLPEGLHFKVPFWQVAQLYETRIKVISFSKDLENSPINTITEDEQQIPIDLSVRYFISGKDAPAIYQKLGSSKDVSEKVIIPVARSVLREVIAEYNSERLVQSRDEVSIKTLEKLEKKYAENNITLQGVDIRNIQFPETYLKAIEEKKVAEQKIQKAEFERQEAEVRKKTIVIQAEAEKQSIMLRGEALRDNPSVIQLQFVEKMAPGISWGILPNDALPLLDLKSLQSQPKQL